jgi:DNA polymerase-3 subunit alpha
LELENHEGRNLMIAAIVTSSEHRITRKGDSFGTLIIEDYNDSYRLHLFQENYLKFKHFMEPGTFIIIKGRIEKTRWRKELEFVVYGMELLQGLRDKKARSLDLKISSNSVDEKMLDELKELLLNAESKGKCRINFTIYDSLDEIQVKLPSRSLSVNPTNELFKKLDSLDIDFKLN